MEQMNKTPELNAMPLVQAALYYASSGWPVFPFVASGKIPYKGSQGYKDTTTDEHQIQAWWITRCHAEYWFSVIFRANLYHRKDSMVVNPLPSPMIKELLI